VTKRDVTDKIRQRVVETSRISGDDESRKKRPIFGYFTFWYIGILFFLWCSYFTPAGLEMHYWYVANIIEVYLESFCLGGGLFVVAAMGLIVDFVFVVRDRIWGRRRRRQREKE